MKDLVGEKAKDRLICTYYQTGLKHDLYERPNGTRYTIETTSGNQTERDKVAKKPKGVQQQGFQNWKSSCKHKPDKAVRVGDLKFYPFAYADTFETDIVEASVNCVYALTSSLFTNLYHKGFAGIVFGMAFPDHSTLPKEVHMKMLNQMCEYARSGVKVGFYCTGGHGRTGTILASLIALLEKPEDPIEVARKRYCKHCVEAKSQAELVFSVMDKELPETYQAEFKKAAVTPWGGTASAYSTRTILGHYGFSWMTRAAVKNLPAWLQSAGYLDFPMLHELDRSVREVYGASLNKIVEGQRGPLRTNTPGIAPAEEEGTFWLICKKTYSACRIAFHHADKSILDGTVLEYVAKLPKTEWANVPLTDEEADKLEVQDNTYADLGEW